VIDACAKRETSEWRRLAVDALARGEVSAWWGRRVGDELEAARRAAAVPGVDRDERERVAARAWETLVGIAADAVAARRAVAP